MEKTVITAIKKRRAIYPPQFTDRAIPRQIIEEILSTANFAPTHKLTQPWRFRVFRTQGINHLQEALVEAMKANTPSEKFSPMKQKKLEEKLSRSSCVLAIVMQRDPTSQIPEWEEIASVAMAVQNIWLTCSEMGIGCYWSSPAYAVGHDIPLFQLKPGERCLGIFYMGWKNPESVQHYRREPIESKITWHE